MCACVRFPSTWTRASHVAYSKFIYLFIRSALSTINREEIKSLCSGCIHSINTLAHIVNSRLSHLHIFFSLFGVVAAVGCWCCFFSFSSQTADIVQPTQIFSTHIFSVIPTCNSTRFISFQRIFSFPFLKLALSLWLILYVSVCYLFGCASARVCVSPYVFF